MVTVGTDLIPIIASAAEAFVAIAGPLATAWGWMKRIAEMTNVVGIGFEALSGDFGAIGQRFTGAPDAATGSSQSQAESDRISAGVEAGFVDAEGFTQAERSQQARDERDAREEATEGLKKAAEKEAEARAKIAADLTGFEGQNAFNSLVEQLFGAEVRANAEAFAANQAKGAENLAAFNQLVEEGAHAQQLLAAEAEQAAKDLASENFALFNQLIDEGAEAQLRAIEANELAASEAEGRLGPRQGVDTAGDIAGVLGAVQGGLGGILSALGPAGAVASGIVGVASNLPEIVDGIIDSLDDILAGLVEGLPKVLFELVPALVTALIKDLPQAISDALLGVLERVVPGLKGKETKSVFGAIAPGVKKLFSGGVLGAAGSSDQQGFASGGFVNRSGMAMVHRGERIESENGVSSSGDNARSRQNGGGGQVNAGGNTFIFNVTGLLDPSGIDRLVEEMNRAIGPRGFGVASVS